MNNKIYTAHRGLTLSSPQVENTLAAIRAAIDNPTVGAIEIDVQQTKDGIFVLSNYQLLENVVRLADPSRMRIADYTYEELNRLMFTPNIKEIRQIISTNGADYGEHAAQVVRWCNAVVNMQSRVTRLDDVLKLDRKGKPLFIEIKTGYKPEQKSEMNEYARSLVRVVGTSDNIFFIGRDINTLEKLKEEKQQVPIMPVIGWTGIESATHPVDGISAAWDALDKQVPGTNQTLGEMVLNKGMGLAVWNILLQREYDGITPEVLNEVQEIFLTGNYPELIEQYSKKRL